MATNRFDRVIQLIAVSCAVVVSLLVIRRELFGGPPGTARETEPVEVKEWTAAESRGIPLGGSSGGISAVVFSDFQCPSCKQFATVIVPQLLTRFGSSVDLRLRHWPLSYHRVAKVAAVSSECAHRQGSFAAVHDLFYQVQDSLDILPFPELARRAGVPDLPAFLACQSDSTLGGQVDADAATALRIGGIGTPTLVIDGYRMPNAMDTTAVFAFINSRLQRREATR